MQFHLDGFRTGDPELAEASDKVGHIRSNAEELPAEVDVLIVGTGPAGLTLAAQLSAFPEITTCITEQRSGPLELGQADGVACRTMEMFNAFGFAHRVLEEAYWVNETSFWRPGGSVGGIVRGGRIRDTEDGLSEFPHVILNQARVHGFYLDVMRKSASRLTPHYNRKFVGLEIDDGEEGPEFPVTATFEVQRKRGEPRFETIRARYVVGCDGARSLVRASIGLELEGDSARQAWGVMDILAVTDFPDIRLKAVINSAGAGSVVLIPREGGYLIRIYVELDELKGDERVADRNITFDTVLDAARRVFAPFEIDVKQVAWWSVYEIGQRLCPRFDNAGQKYPSVFIAGDACHTHSPKAGQGMNVSMQDAFNLGWKLAAVLKGNALPELLSTYSTERHAIARELIEFDKEWAAMLSAPVKAANDPDGEGVDPAAVQDYFVRSGRYTAGTATKYQSSMITAASAFQGLASGFPIGERFHSTPVIRLSDAKPMHLGHAIEADGRWRIFAFAGTSDPMLRALSDFLESDVRSPLVWATPAGADVDSIVDVRAIFQQPHGELAVGDMPDLLLPRKGRLGLRDYEKMFCPCFDGSGNIFDVRGIDLQRGCMVVVRPDQFVANIVALTAYDELSSFFSAVLLPAKAGGKPLQTRTALREPSADMKVLMKSRLVLNDAAD